MLDGKRSSIPGSLRVSSLSDITMYTINEDVPLREIIKSMYDKNKGKAAISHNSSPQEVKDFVDSVVDDLDHDRVYASDLRKLVQWYNLLISQKALPFEEEEEKEDGKSDDKKAPSKKKPTAKNKQASSKKPLAKKAPTKKSTKTTKK